MMDPTSQHINLSRLLDLSNRIHDIQRQILQEPVPMPGPALLEEETESRPQNSIAEMQEKIDQGNRASLVTCWFGLPE